jgi:hypothetical protein
MVTGRPPFESANTNEVVAAHMRDRPRRASKLTPDLPESLDLLIARCLEKDRELRYQSMAELVEALDRVIQDEAPGDGPADRTVALRPQPTTLTAGTGHRMRTTITVRRGTTLVMFGALAIAAFGISALIASELSGERLSPQPSRSAASPPRPRESAPSRIVRPSEPPPRTPSVDAGMPQLDAVPVLEAPVAPPRPSVTEAVKVERPKKKKKRAAKRRAKQPKQEAAGADDKPVDYVDRDD